MEMAQFQRGVLSTLLPPRNWPVIALTLLAPLSIGLSLHALIQLDPWMYGAALLTGIAALALGSLPAAVDGEPGGAHRVRIAAGGERRTLSIYLALAVITMAAWELQPVRLASGLAAFVAGLVYLVSLTLRNRRAGRQTSRISDMIPWCYVLGPSGALALATLAMRPTHLGSWREFVYLGLGRVAAVVAVLFLVLVERELRRRFGRAVPERFLPYRILTLLLALTGFLVPGGGTPFAVSWAIAWFIAAIFERRLALSRDAA